VSLPDQMRCPECGLPPIDITEDACAAMDAPTLVPIRWSAVLIHCASGHGWIQGHDPVRGWWAAGQRPSGDG
jgi:hypothetical protein